MRRASRLSLLAGGALALTSVWAIAQDAPESLLPPGFERPARSPGSAPDGPVQSGAEPSPTASPVVQAIPRSARTRPRSAEAPAVAMPSGLPSLEALEAMTPEQLDEALGLRPRDDIPPAARRAMERVGILAEGEGGMPFWNLGRQDPALVGAALQGNGGRMISRWGHILVRRALASRLDAPSGMNPADFAEMRAALLVRMGEGDAARVLVQDVDTANYTPALTQAALDAYVATADFTGICPVVTLQGSARKDKPWQVLDAMCDAFSGEGTRAITALDRLTYYGAMPRIDMLLAQRYAGAAGKTRRAVTIEWDKVEDMTPWRYAMTTAIGLQPPASLMQGVSTRYAFMAATAPALALNARAAAADQAAASGVMSSTAMVDLYAQIHDEEGAEGEWATRAGRLRDAYLAPSSDDRLAAIKELWGDSSDPQRRYARQVLTAYAAARLPVNTAWRDDAGSLIGAMLAAGLDANALRWAPAAEAGSEGWALLALAAPQGGTVDTGAIDDFRDADISTDARKTRFLVAGLAGLGRLPVNTAQDLAGRYGFRLDRQSRWTRMINLAAQHRNPALVALLAGLGMQGESWEKMTPRNLYHIVAALNRVGLAAEARMIAAEAVARA